MKGSDWIDYKGREQHLTDAEKMILTKASYRPKMLHMLLETGVFFAVDFLYVVDTFKELTKVGQNGFNVDRTKCTNK